MTTTEESASTDETAAPEEEKAYELSLDVDITDAGPCRKHVKITVPRKDLDHFYDEELVDLEEKAEVPGFRVGHAPRKLIQKRFKKELDNQVKQKVLMSSLEQMESADQLEPISEPDIDVESVEIPEEGDFTFDFEVEVRPQFDLPDYKGLEIERPIREATDEDVEYHKQVFLSQFAKYEDTEEPAAEGHSVVLDIAFAHNGKNLREHKGVTAEVKPVLRFPDGEVSDFGDIVTGKNAGDSIESETVVSQEADSIELRGETVQVSFRIQKVRKIIPPTLNKAFLDEIGVESEEDLTKQVRETIERRLTYQQRQAVREQVLEKITESADWDLPEDLVRKQVENHLRRQRLEMQQAGFTRQQMQSRENELRQNIVSTTRQALKEHFVLDKIAEKEEIEVPQEELDMEITLMALQQGESARAVRTRLARSGMMENMAAQIRERKAVDVILEQAKFEDIESDEPMSEDDVEAVDVSICGDEAPPTTDADWDEDAAE